MLNVTPKLNQTTQIKSPDFIVGLIIYLATQLIGQPFEIKWIIVTHPSIWRLPFFPFFFLFFFNHLTNDVQLGPDKYNLSRLEMKFDLILTIYMSSSNKTQLYDFLLNFLIILSPNNENNTFGSMGISNQLSFFYLFFFKFLSNLDANLWHMVNTITNTSCTNHEKNPCHEWGTSKDRQNALLIMKLSFTR